MGFWGGGGSSSDDPVSSSSSSNAKDFTSVDESFGGGGMMSPPASPGASAGAGQAEMQQFAVALQQQALIQKAITVISDVAFEKCLTGKPGDSLSSSQVVCIASTTNKWLDTNEFMVGRLAKKQQAQAPGFS